MRGSALAPEAGTCSTTKIVAGRSALSAATNSLRLPTPPAEAPTTTRSRQPIALVAAVAIGSAVELIYAFPSADSFVGQGPPGGGTLLSELDNLDFTPAMRLWTASELRRFGNAAGRFWHRSVVGVTQLADALPIRGLAERQQTVQSRL